MHLYEQLFLLALRDKEGTIMPIAYYQYAIAGSILADLLLQKKVGLDQTKRSPYIIDIPGAMTGDDLLAECLEKINQADRSYAGGCYDNLHYTGHNQYNCV